MRKALVVGIDNYPGCPLQGCRNDSEAIEDLLANNENGDPNFSVFKKDDVPTKGELREHIRKCFDGDCEVALFYYSGMGISIPSVVIWLLPITLLMIGAYR